MRLWPFRKRRKTLTIAIGVDGRCEGLEILALGVNRFGNHDIQYVAAKEVFVPNPDGHHHSEFPVTADTDAIDLVIGVYPEGMSPLSARKQAAKVIKTAGGL